MDKHFLSKDFSTCENKDFFFYFFILTSLILLGSSYINLIVTGHKQAGLSWR